MTNKAWMLASLIPIVCMIAIAGACAVLGGCDGTLQCGDKTVPMHCHWAFKASLLLSCVGLIASVCTLTAKTKEARRLTAICTLAVAAGCALMLTSAGVGICASAMECHQNAPFVWALAAVTALTCLLQITKADPEQAELPKMKL